MSGLPSLASLRLPAGVDERMVANAIAACRIGLGVAYTVVPGLSMRGWPGGDSHRRATARLLARHTGGRDLAIGLGTLIAARRNAPLRGWLEAGMLADGVDALGILLAARELPKGRALVAFLSAAGAVVAGRLIVDALD